MTPLAVDPQGEAVRLCRDDTVGDHDLARLVVARDVTGEDRVDALERARLDHHPRPATALLRRLEDEDDVPVGAVGGEARRRLDDHRHVRVVTARMHPAGMLRRERQPRRLLARQRVHLGADRDGGRAPNATAQPRDDAGPGPSVRRLEAERRQRAEEALRRPHLLERELGDAVQASPQLDDVGRGDIERAHADTSCSACAASSRATSWRARRVSFRIAREARGWVMRGRGPAA